PRGGGGPAGSAPRRGGSVGARRGGARPWASRRGCGSQVARGPGRAGVRPRGPGGPPGVPRPGPALNMQPTVLLFDVDGTLVTTGGVGRRALEIAFERSFGRRDAC